MMKKVVKKMFVMAMAVTVATTAVPVVSVEAAVDYPTAVTLNRTSTKYETYSSFSVDGLSKSTKIYPKTLKSTNKAVLVPWYMQKYYLGYESTTNYLDDNGNLSGDPSKYGYSDYYAYIGFRTKKAGTATLSYKIDKTNCKTKVTAKAYKNPLKTANIAGIKNGSSTNLASKLKNENYAYFNMKSKKNDATVKFVANSGWRITNVEVENKTSGTTYRMTNYGKGVGSKSLNIGDVKKTDVLEIEVNLTNTKDGTSQYCTFYVNN